MLPIAREAAGRGHEILISAQPLMLPMIEAEGFEAIDSGGHSLRDPATRGELTVSGRARLERALRTMFAGAMATDRAERLLTVIAERKPDVIVRDELDFGAAVAAERHGVPHVGVVVLAAGGMLRPDVVGEPLRALRTAHGLPTEPDDALMLQQMLHQFLTLAPMPPGFRDPTDPLPADAEYFRPAVLDPSSRSKGSSAVLDWLDRRPERPVIYFSLGTEANKSSGDLFARVLAGLGRLDADVVATIGQDIDPAELGPQPESVRVEQFVPQEQLLPRCAAVVSHAGSGSVIGALASGVPLVLLPLSADQPVNAERCVTLGVAHVLDPFTATGADVAAAVTEVLHNPSYRAAAGQLRAESLRLPTAAEMLDRIEALAMKSTA
jgi:UDP:flavonoid glycosyltransferase YjiC (YdhE family)